MTHFFFDLFSTEDCVRMVDGIKPVVHRKTIWLIADFIDTTWWHGAMVAIMYRFFRIVSGVKTNALPEWEIVMMRAGFHKIGSQKFYKGFIKSAIFCLEKENGLKKI